jgi:hypothetical protein
MPYGYFMLVRFVALIGFGYLAFQANEENRKNMSLIYIALALLFQPFFKISLGCELWNIVDLIVALGLIISIFYKPKTS